MPNQQRNGLPKNNSHSTSSSTGEEPFYNPWTQFYWALDWETKEEHNRRKAPDAENAASKKSTKGHKQRRSQSVLGLLSLEDPPRPTSRRLNTQCTSPGSQPIRQVSDPSRLLQEGGSKRQSRFHRFSRLFQPAMTRTSAAPPASIVDSDTAPLLQGQVADRMEAESKSDRSIRTIWGWLKRAVSKSSLRRREADGSRTIGEPSTGPNGRSQA
ncbi:uncharacterized protein CTHT_0065120 [Thermochaetoides thermophila DSM 1495]|uniref:Uncharacterized protein n=1 Tax=Chaetomium thermophilum (strain DSM 1495 / CBS 144.50 / IMI 039719) TaxID=759272 RepID=G0SG58_CHATD|nr:hypothetical protein CTHT_0065120 [Thermochaetoides thermophila DSM 1495]EGS17197.1 hypothetical protein CTHT_0065120 [Thermochaetoides thermophila DSM 1495]